MNACIRRRARSPLATVLRVTLAAVVTLSACACQASSPTPLSAQSADTQEKTMNAKEADIREVVGGHFTPDALSPEVYNALVVRIKAAPLDYLDTFDAMYLGNDFDAKQQSELYLPTFLELVAPQARDRARQSARNLLKRYDAVMVVYDDAPKKEALFATLPEETVRFLQRLEVRRMELRALAK